METQLSQEETSPERELRWEPVTLYPKQAQAIFDPHRWVFVEAGTKSGKSTGCHVWLNELSFEIGAPGRNFWWVSPFRKQAKEIGFNRAVNSLPQDLIDVNHSELVIENKVNGARLHYKTAEKPDALYGDDVYGLVLDEATRMRPEVWPAVRSTLTATRGRARIVGNMRGRLNWVHKLALAAQAGTLKNAAYHTLTSMDAVAAGVLGAEEIEDAKATLPEEVFKELYMAIPSEEGSNPFGGKELEACLIPEFSKRATEAWGWDLGRKVNWTVGIGLDKYMKMTAERAMRHESWRYILAEIMKLVGRTPALVDETGVGDPPVERLKEEGGDNYHGFIFSPQSRQRLLEDLAIGIHSAEIGVVRSSRAHDELSEFGYEFTRRGGVKYVVPEGYHDDAVMSLALAYRMMRMRDDGLRIL